MMFNFLLGGFYHCYQTKWMNEYMKRTSLQHKIPNLRWPGGLRSKLISYLEKRVRQVWFMPWQKGLTEINTSICLKSSQFSKNQEIEQHLVQTNQSRNRIHHVLGQRDTQQAFVVITSYHCLIFAISIDRLDTASLWIPGRIWLSRSTRSCWIRSLLWKHISLLTLDDRDGLNKFLLYWLGS